MQYIQTKHVSLAFARPNKVDIPIINFNWYVYPILQNDHLCLMKIYEKQIDLSSFYAVKMALKWQSFIKQHYYISATYMYIKVSEMNIFSGRSCKCYYLTNTHLRYMHWTKEQVCTHHYCCCTEEMALIWANFPNNFISLQAQNKLWWGQTAHTSG